MVHLLCPCTNIKTICENAGESGDVIVHEVLKKKNFNYGYDAKNKKYTDLAPFRYKMIRGIDFYNFTK